MDDGYYLIALVSATGAACTARVFVSDNQIVGQGISLSFYGYIHDSSIVLNVERNPGSRMNSILGEYYAYSFSGYLSQTPDGYFFETDAYTELPVEITLKKVPEETA